MAHARRIKWKEDPDRRFRSGVTALCISSNKICARYVTLRTFASPRPPAAVGYRPETIPPTSRMDGRAMPAKPRAEIYQLVLNPAAAPAIRVQLPPAIHEDSGVPP